MSLPGNPDRPIGGEHQETGIGATPSAKPPLKKRRATAGERLVQPGVRGLGLAGVLREGLSRQFPGRALKKAQEPTPLPTAWLSGDRGRQGDLKVVGWPSAAAPRRAGTETGPATCCIVVANGCSGFLGSFPRTAE